MQPNREKTLEFIKHAHAGQEYDPGVPYWTHPVQVAQTIENPTENEYIAALLHDIVEDTEYSLTDLADMGYNLETLNIVSLLTKKPGMKYNDAIQGIIDSGNRSAMKVKLADNIVNNSGDKSHMNPERRSRLEKKYGASIHMLRKALQ